MEQARKTTYISLLFLAILVISEGTLYEACHNETFCSVADGERCTPVSVSTLSFFKMCLPEKGTFCQAATDCPAVGSCVSGACGGCTSDNDCTSNTNFTKCSLGSPGLCGSCFNDTDCNIASEYCDSGPLVLRDNSGLISGAIPLANVVLPTLACTARKKNGQKCENDDQCLFSMCDIPTGLCGGNLANLLADGQQCSSGSQCKAGVCRRSVFPRVCGLFQVNEKCSMDVECAAANCTNGKCVDPSQPHGPGSSNLADGEICTLSLECASAICSLQTNGVKRCGLISGRANGVSCMVHGECASGYCGGFFFFKQCKARAALGGTCANHAECDTGLICHKDSRGRKTCVASGR